MGGRVVCGLALVVGGGYDLAPPRDNGTDGDFPFLGGAAGLLQGQAHHGEVRVARGLRDILMFKVSIHAADNNLVKYGATPRSSRFVFLEPR